MKNYLQTLLFCSTLFINNAYGQITIEEVQVDTSITGFSCIDSPEGIKIYTKVIDNSNFDISTFSVSVPDYLTFNDAIKSLEHEMEMYNQDGYKITDLIKEDKIINNNRTFIMSYSSIDALNNTDKQFKFNAVVLKQNSVILFTSTDYEKGKYLDKLKNTFYSLKF